MTHRRWSRGSMDAAQAQQMRRRWPVMTLPMVAMRPRKVSQGLMTAGALAVAAFVALYFPNRDDTGGAILVAAFAFLASVIGLAASDAFAR
jgi:hypothetical protein